MALQRPGASRGDERWIFMIVIRFITLLTCSDGSLVGAKFGVPTRFNCRANLPGRWPTILQCEVQGISAGRGFYVSGRWVGI